MKDSWVEEAGVEESFFVAAGVCPSEVAGWEMPESLGLVITSQLAGPSVERCTYESKVLGEGSEDQTIAGGRVSYWFVSFYTFSL